ncbi:filamentous hemagglutinin N-terminal domain-containing protein, partial [Massilia arenosa]
MNKRILPILLAASFGAAIAAPTAPVVVSGQATFAQQGNVFSITNTPNAIINWQSFNIAPGEITRFIQQNADSAVLNRITGQDPSQILGALQSNGHVFLINPNGIMFGKDARIDVNGLTASTLNISNADFIAGKRNFASGGAAGAVANQGTIITPNGGSVFLIAPQVENSGIITAPNGQVVLAAGHTVQLVDSGNPDLHVVVSAPADQAINLGQVIAQGGRIGIYGALVNQRGIVNANSAVVGANGKIVLKASRDTLLEQGSVTTATGAGPGGDIRLLGARVGLTGNAQVDASGATGGGSVLVGGDYQGKNADQVAHAQNTWLGQGASIKADAIQTGNGGKVVLWSDGATSAFGSISARGGANGGNGGVVETSGHDLTVAGARVDTSAAKGKRGSWLLDPQNIIVDTTGSTPLADAAAFSSLPGADALVSKATLEAATSDVILQATNDITFNTAVNLGHALNATAGHAINVNADLTAGNIALTGDSINLAAGKKINSSNGCGSSCSVEFKANTLVFGPSSGSDITAVTASGSNSVISIVPLTGSRTMQFIDAAHRDSGKLSLTPTELGSLHAAEVNLGSSASTGDFLWSWAGGYPSGAFNTIVIETGGNIIFDNRLEMQDAGTIVLGSYGSGSITFNPSGELSAGKVFFRTDNLTLNSIAGITASDSINIDTYHLYRDIKLGSGAVDGAALAIDQTELDQLKSAKLEFGSATRTAPIEVVGNALYSQSTAQQMTLNLGTGGLTVYGAFDGGSNGTLLLNSNGGGITATSSGNLKANRVHIAGNGGTIVDLDNGAANYISALTGSDLGQLNIKLGGGSHIGSGTSGVTVTGTGGVYVKSLAGLIIDSVLDGGSGGVNLVGDNEGTLTVNSGGIVVGDNVTLDFFHGMNLAGHIAAVGDSGRLDIDSTGTLALGGSASATGLHANLYMHSTGATTLNGTVTADGEANVRSDAAIQVNGLLHANGDIYVEGQAITTGSTGLIYGPDLTVISKDSIGSSSAPLMTRVGGLWAQVENNNASIYVRNNLLAPGPLNLRLAYRFGAAFDSPGMVSIVNDGAMTLANRSTESSMQETVRSGQGDIHLETHSPLTIGGIVRSTTGNIDLIAGDGGELKVTNPGFVSSTSGNVSLTGGTIIAPAGSVVTTGTVTQNQT